MWLTEWLGRRPYREVWRRQLAEFDARVERRRRGEPAGPDLLLTVEHLPVITLGRHGREENLIVPAEALGARGIEVVRIERGGDITYHGPGQLVAYPIVDLSRLGIGVKDYVGALEDAVIATVGSWGIRAGREEGRPGVWVEPATPRSRKICALGIRVSRGITMHGLALNVATDLDAFRAINPCGFSADAVTSMARELGGRAPAMDDVRLTLERELREALQRRSTAARAQPQGRREG